MIVLGVILLILGILFGISVLTYIGVVLIVIGAVFWILGATGRAVGQHRDTEKDPQYQEDHSKNDHRSLHSIR